MQVFKNILISVLIIIGITMISAFIINILHYFDLLNKNLYKGLIMFFMIINTFIGGYYLGTKSNNKGYIKGLFLGIVIVLLFIILSFVLNEPLSVSSLIYYSIILITSIISSAIGINKKATDHSN